MNNISPDEPRYNRIRATQLANISVQFLEMCETERLIEVRFRPADQPCYSINDIRQLSLIGRLHNDLELDFPALEIVLHLRRQLMDLQEQVDELERQSSEREERLMRELIKLRSRFADEADWD
jgi:DNA-binding transcriptional MerR regulator